ncbi:MAG TPA: hypothetical protein PLW65_13145 [Pseudomonadota bacterium]|nr:hypothetical protein [Pseudomonadota bacterium]
MRALFMILTAFLYACGPAEQAPTITTGPNIVRTAAGCARPLSDGRYINDKLGVSCHFAKLNGARVCIPDGLPAVIGGSCIPTGDPTGQFKVTIDLSKDGCGAVPGRYVLFPKDTGAPLKCDDFVGSIREVKPALSADQRTYFGPNNRDCKLSPLTASPEYPYVDLVSPSIVLYEDDMPAEVCR